MTWVFGSGGSTLTEVVQFFLLALVHYRTIDRVIMDVDMPTDADTVEMTDGVSEEALEQTLEFLFNVTEERLEAFGRKMDLIEQGITWLEGEEAGAMNARRSQEDDERNAKWKAEQTQLQTQIKQLNATIVNQRRSRDTESKAAKTNITKLEGEKDKLQSEASEQKKQITSLNKTIKDLNDKISAQTRTIEGLQNSARKFILRKPGANDMHTRDDVNMDADALVPGDAALVPGGGGAPSIAPVDAQVPGDAALVSGGDGAHSIAPVDAQPPRYNTRSKRSRTESQTLGSSRYLHRTLHVHRDIWL